MSGMKSYILEGQRWRQHDRGAHVRLSEYQQGVDRHRRVRDCIWFDSGVREGRLSRRHWNRSWAQPTELDLGPKDGAGIHLALVGLRALSRETIFPVALAWLHARNPLQRLFAVGDCRFCTEDIKIPLNQLVPCNLANAFVLVVFRTISRVGKTLAAPQHLSAAGSIPEPRLRGSRAASSCTRGIRASVHTDCSTA